MLGLSDGIKQSLGWACLHCYKEIKQGHLCTLGLASLITEIKHALLDLGRTRKKRRMG